MKTNQTTWIAAGLAAVGGALVTGVYYGKQYGVGPFARMFYNSDNFQEVCPYSTQQMEQLLQGEMMLVQDQAAAGLIDMNQAIETMEDGAIRLMAQCRRAGLTA